METSRSKHAAVMLLALFAIFSAGAFADHRDNRRHDNNGRKEHFDNRYSYDRYYPQRGPQRGSYVPGISRNRIVVNYRGGPYYFDRGAWYRPYGPRFIVVAPPIGIAVPFLPPFYTTIWFGGSPYYYADDTYYAWRPDRRDYVVTSPW